MKESENICKKFELIIIEDDDGLGRLMQKEFVRNGFNVSLAQTGEKALELIKGTQNEILLTDYKLPDMSGKQLILKFQEKYGYSPNFITLTGYGSERIAVEMMKLGSRDYIVKEQNFIELLHEVLKRVCTDLNNEIKLQETEADLKKNLELLKETGEMARVGGWEIDLKTNKVIWTDTTKTIHEVPPGYLPDLSEALDFFPKGARDKIEKAVEQAIGKGKEYNLELPFVTAKGKNLWVVAKGNPQMKDGKCVRLHGTFQDITKRKEAELELKRKSAILKRTEQIAHVGSWDWDVETDTIKWSDEMFRIFKLDSKKAPESYADHSKMYTPDSRKKLDAAVRKGIDTGEPYEFDLQIIRGDGKYAYCHVTGFTKKNKNGKVIRLFGSLQDITERKTKEKHLKKINKKLSDSEKANRELAFKLGERVKEINCLYSIASVIEKPGISLEEILQESVRFIPSGWQSPEKTFVRIIYGNKEYKTTPFRETKIKTSHQLFPNDPGRGAIEVFLNEDDEQTGEKPVFLKEEKELLFLISERISKVIDRFEATEQLKQIRVLLEETERAGKIGGWEIDAQTNRQNWTQEVFRILEIDTNEQEPEVPEGINFIDPKYRIKAEKAVQKALKEGKPFDEEWVVTTAKGNKRWVNAVCKSKVVDGKIVKIYGSFQDITKRKEAEIKLKAAYNQLKASEQQLMAGNQQLAALNQQLISGEQQLTAANQQLVANEQQLKAANQQLVANEQQLRAANLQLKANEKELIKERNNSRKNEKRYKKAQEVGHIGSWEYNLETEEFWGSDEAKRIYNLNLNRKDFPVDEVMEIVVGEDREKVNRAMADLVGKNKPYDIVFEIIPKNTSERKIIRSIAELEKDESGKPLKVTGVLHDITLQKTIEKQLIRSKEKAEEADRLKSSFLANMSHEIRTPMNGILGFTDLLKNPELSGEQQQKFIEIIHKSGNRMLETVNAIIDISRIETGQTDVKLSTIDIKEEIESLYSFFSQETEQRGLKLEIEELPLENLHCLTDKYKFNSIFTNLIKNAIKFTTRGSIKIGCKISDNRLHCYVKDTGIGIPDNRQHAIFNRFEQADIEDTNAYEGSGLGLAIAKAYAEMLGGEIGVQSKESEGSTFWFNLPERAEKLRKERDENKSENSGNKILRKLKIIVAEDDETSAEYLSVLLKQTAGKILLATTGKDTVELCKKNPDADLVLMDIKMPKGNGYDTLAEIRKFNDNIKIIAQTANALAGDRKKALDAGFDEYVSKPVRKQDMITKIEKLFG